MPVAHLSTLVNTSKSFANNFYWYNKTKKSSLASLISYHKCYIIKSDTAIPMRNKNCKTVCKLILLHSENKQNKQPIPQSKYK